MRLPSWTPGHEGSGSTVRTQRLILVQNFFEELRQVVPHN